MPKRPSRSGPSASAFFLGGILFFLFPLSPTCCVGERWKQFLINAHPHRSLLKLYTTLLGTGAFKVAWRRYISIYVQVTIVQLWFLQLSCATAQQQLRDALYFDPGVVLTRARARMAGRHDIPLRCTARALRRAQIRHAMRIVALATDEFSNKWLIRLQNKQAKVTSP